MLLYQFHNHYNQSSYYLPGHNPLSLFHCQPHHCQDSVRFAEQMILNKSWYGCSITNGPLTDVNLIAFDFKFFYKINQTFESRKRFAASLTLISGRLNCTMRLITESSSLWTCPSFWRNNWIDRGEMGSSTDCSISSVVRSSGRLRNRFWCSTFICPLWGLLTRECIKCVLILIAVPLTLSLRRFVRNRPNARQLLDRCPCCACVGSCTACLERWSREISHSPRAASSPTLRT